MGKRKKQLSNAFSTGGGGPNFETRVQAAFVVLMLANGVAPCLPRWPIKRIKLQGRHVGYDTDDLIVFVESPEGKKAKLLCQIKHSLKIADRDPVFGEVIQAAWDDFNKPELFTPETDSIAVITGPLSATDSNDVRTLLMWARKFDNEEDFLKYASQTNCSSKPKMRKLAAFRTCLHIAKNGSNVSDVELWRFMRSFHLLGYDLDFGPGVILSLLHSLIGQYSTGDVNGLWTQILDEVQGANQSAGAITLDSLPRDIRLAFQKPGVTQIPSGLGIKPSAPGVLDYANSKFAPELAVASLLGAWNERPSRDRSVVEQLANERYDVWISSIREALQQAQSPVSLTNGTWAIYNRREVWETLSGRVFDDHLDRLCRCAVDVLKEHDPKFEMPPDERYMANVRGKVLMYSHALRKGLAETLALLGSQGGALTYCSAYKAEAVAATAIREVFADSDWTLWASLNILLPTLAEAAPGEFLAAVEESLQKTPCPFDQLFAQERSGISGANYMTGLLWALETLAWEEEYLVRATIILGRLASRDPGGNWGNRPSNSLNTIFLPWLPQTTASFDKRKVAVQTLQKESPAVAWKLLLKLLPNSSQTSSGCQKPVWRQTILNNSQEGVSKEEYWNQVSFYGDAAIEMARSDPARLQELVGDMDNLTGPALEKLLAHLESAETANRPEDERLYVWEALGKLASKHRQFSDTDWAFGKELVERIEHVAAVLAPENPLNLYRHLFTQREFDFYEKGSDWKTWSKKVDERRQAAMREIVNHGGVEDVFRLVRSVDSPDKVGYSLGIVGEHDIDSEILPDLLDKEDKKLTSFATGFIWGRHRKSGWVWAEAIVVSGWSQSQTGKLLSQLPFTEETWKLSQRLLGNNGAEYWSRVDASPYQVDGDIGYAIDKLMEYNRPKAALRCAYAMLNLKKALDKTKTSQVLLAAVSSPEPNYSVDSYEIGELIKALQDDPGVDPKGLSTVEWVYLPLLTGPGRNVSPRLLEHKLASDPDFFSEAIGLLYRSKNEPESREEPTEQRKAMAENMWMLLHYWRTPPGTLLDGDFAADVFSEWIGSVKTQCAKSGHIDIALHTVGEVLIHSLPDPGGLWIHKSVAEVLNAEDAEQMRNGFYIATLNSRGAHIVDPEGKPEKELAAKYRQQGDEVENAGYHRFAVTLRSLAKWYECEADRNVERYKARHRSAES